MKKLLCLAILVFALSACAKSSSPPVSDTQAKIERHCREHANEMFAEDSAERRFQECMALHGSYSIPELDEHLAGGGGH